MIFKLFSLLNKKGYEYTLMSMLVVSWPICSIWMTFNYLKDLIGYLWFVFTNRLSYPPPLPPMVPLSDSFNKGPNVLPLSVLILATGSLLVAFLSHHVTITLLSLSPNVSICASCESALVVLLRLILSPKVLPPSVEL